MSKLLESQVYRLYENTNLTDEILKMAKEELGETNQIRSESLRLLKWKIEETKNFYPNMDDSFLLKFLRVSKFDVGKAFDRLQNYYKQRIKYPEIYETLYPSAHREFVASFKSHYVLPHRNTDNTPIFVCNKRIGVMHYSYENVVRDIQLDMMIFEALLNEPVDQIGGLTVIADLGEYHILDCCRTITPRNVQAYMSNAINVVPGRLKAVHFVNTHRAFNLFFRMIYPFIPQKLKSRVMVHPKDGWKSLHMHIPPEILPEEYGGKQGPMDHSFFQRILESKDAQFKENLKYGYRMTTGDL